MDLLLEGREERFEIWDCESLVCVCVCVCGVSVSVKEKK